MNEYLIYLLIGIVFLAIGYFLGNYIQALKTKSTQSALEERELQLHHNIAGLEQRLIESDSHKAQVQSEKEQLGNQIVRYQADLENLQQKNREQKEEVQKLQEKFTKEFENLANRILEEKSLKFTEQNRKNIQQILEPLKEKIKTFEDKVERTHKESIDYHSALRQQIFGLKELNQQMSKDADNLTKALKGDSKVQGNWGELILTRVLESSGLSKGREYTVQESIVDNEGNRLQPDVLIHLPDGKKMVVDSKVSLTNYEKYVSSEEETDRNIYLKKHINSIRTHVSQLSSKKYHYLIDESPDTIFMFVPNEPAFTAAASNSHGLYQEAFDKQVIIVTPSMLFATMKLVDNLWQNDRQKQNALEIAKKAGALYDSFTNLTDELMKVGKQMDTAKGTYDTAMKKLIGKGNLIKKVENLKALGAKASKSINEKLFKKSQENNLPAGEVGFEKIEARQ